jgi:hypothetical protein
MNISGFYCVSNLFQKINGRTNDFSTRSFRFLIFFEKPIKNVALGFKKTIFDLPKLWVNNLSFLATETSCETKIYEISTG